MADPKLWSKLDSTDVEDAAELGRIYSMRPVMPSQRHCNCIHDALPHTPGARRSRNLVVCIDGTANQFSDKNTNVVELYSRLEKSDHLQVTFYNSGIGTYANPSWKSLTYYRQVIYHKIDLAIAWRFEKILLSAYEWLCEQYQTGDRIFLFGFSRGAYQVRALSAMIEKVGLIHRGNEAQIPFAYELYQRISNRESAAKDKETSKGSKLKKPDSVKEDAKQNTPKVTTPTSPYANISEPDTMFQTEQRTNVDVTDADFIYVPTASLGVHFEDRLDDDPATSFKRTFCREDVKVHFVGVWDTVSSVGFAKKKELPLTTDGMKHVCIFRHALALDERRVKFLPEFVNGGEGPKDDGQGMGASEMPHTKEVWFTGTHSDIGGGNIENRWLNNNGPALRWMTTEASKAGLLLTPFAWRWDEIKKVKEVNESLTGLWRILEILPIKRLSYASKDGVTRRQVFFFASPSNMILMRLFRPHLGRRRKIRPGQLVHRSVYGSDRLHPSYKENLGEWDGKDPSKIEPDRFDQVTHHIEYAIDLLGNMENAATDIRFNHLLHLHETSYLFGTVDEGIQAYINLSQSLFHPSDLSNVAYRKRLIATMEVLQFLAARYFQKQHLSKQPPIIPEIFSIRRNGPVTSFAFSPDGRCIACGTDSGTIFFRDVRTGAGMKSRWNTTDIRANARISYLAFSPDGKMIASGSWDSLVQVWDVETGAPVKNWYPNRVTKFLSVSFSADGHLLATSESCDFFFFRPPLDLLVSSFDDDNDEKEVDAVEEVKEAEMKPEVRPNRALVLRGHQHAVLSAAFSPKTSFEQTGVVTHQPSLPALITQGRAEQGVQATPDLDTDSTISAVTASSSLDSGTNPNDPHTSPGPHTNASNGACTRTDGDTARNPTGTGTPTNSGSSTLAVAKLPQNPFQRSPSPYIISGSRDKTFRVWSTFGKPKEVWTSPPQDDEIRVVAFSEDDTSKVFIGSRDGSVSRWDVTQQRKDFSWLASTSLNGGDGSTFPGGERVPVNSLAVASVSRVACGLDDGRVTLWDLSEGKPVFYGEVQHPASVTSLSFSSDGKRFAACTREGIVVVCDAEGAAGSCILEQLTTNDRWFP
ncbi:hypothetical protein VNI00_000879 [Paramarasmius palmivorus]|uniref:T6SS Phospholipase effector Tle1-like catalytic domain-containing protein n=1 Tax=Paramarasmius palmivorus TaxID=297713 RepID=A0AAW0E7H1_9AGAR